jgi:YD repeat-containing protein
MRYPLTLAFVLSFFAMSCSDEESGGPNNKPPELTACVLTSVTTAIASNTFVRNEEGIITAINYKYGDFVNGCTIEYDSKEKVLRINDDKFHTVYTYDSDGRVATETFVNENPTPPEPAEVVRTFDYNASGQLAKIKYTSGEYYRYEYNADGNVRAVFAYKAFGSEPEYLQREYLEYDDKFFSLKDVPFTVNTTLTLAGVKSIRTALSFGQMINNYRKIKQYGSDGSVVTQSFGFTYNEIGYPTALTGDYQATFNYSCK